MNGFEFANEALSIKGYELDSIIEITDGLEVDWLEFKAAIKPQGSQEAAKYNDADYIFNLVKALVSMANGAGGLVVLGINDEGIAVGLEKSGFEGDKDKFTRYISDKIFLRDGWRTKLSGHWRWKDTTDQIGFDPQWAQHQGIDVLAFAVSPRDKSLGPLVLTHTANKNAEEVDTVFIRTGGDRGKVIRRSTEDAINWWEKRNLNSFSRKFKTWIRELQKTEPEVYQSAISIYCNDIATYTSELEDTYVPLEVDVRIPRKSSARRNHSSDDDYLAADLEGEQPSEWRGEFEEIVTSVYPAFLIGEPGAGKTTSLQKLARGLCVDHTSDPEVWALYVPLSGYTTSGLQALICREVPPLNWSDLQLGLESGKLTLVLDGLNECPSAHYDQCATDLIDLLKEHPESKILVSTRSSHLPAFKQKTIELRAMGSGRQRQFIKNYLGGNPDDERAFWKALTQKWTAQMIARSPILLRMAVWVWVEYSELPGGLAELYSTFFDAWLRREVNKDLDTGAANYWSEDEVREGLSLLAYSMRCDGLVACTQTNAENYLNSRLGDRSHSFISRVVQGLMIEKDKNKQIIIKYSVEIKLKSL